MSETTLIAKLKDLRWWVLASWELAEKLGYVNLPRWLLEAAFTFTFGWLICYIILSLAVKIATLVFGTAR
jgi:hypothetical protein